MKDIIVIGSLNMDLVVQTGRMPGAGETLHGKEFHTIPGGKGANQAVAAVRLGGQVRMVGRVGQDAFGETLRRNLQADGVDVSRLLSDPSAPTGVALIVVEDSGENRIIVISGTNGHVSPADVQAAEQIIRDAALVLAQFEVPMPAVEAAVRLAHKCGVPTLINAAPAYEIEAGLYPLIDYLVVNEHEAATLSGVAVMDLSSAAVAARALVGRGVKNVVLTLGAQGSWVCGPSGAFHVPTFPVKAVDTTAAGDAFIGGLAVSLQSGAGDLREVVRFANAAGALTATRIGAQSSLPTEAEVKKLISQSVISQLVD